MTIFKIVLTIIFVLYTVNRIMPAKGVKQLTLEELSDQLNDKDTQLIDVRTPREFSARRLKGFKNIPLKELKQETDTLSKDKKLIIVCETGMRSMQACKRLKREGFTKLINVRGGITSNT